MSIGNCSRELSLHRTRGNFSTLASNVVFLEVKVEIFANRRMTGTILGLSFELSACPATFWKALSPYMSAISKRSSIKAKIKLILFIGIGVGTYLIWMLGMFVVHNKIAWRRLIFHKYSTLFLRFSNLKIEVIGQPPNPPFLLVANHLSYVDIAVIRSVAETIFVAKSDVKGWFLAGRIIRDMGTVFVNRDNHRDVLRVQGEIFERLDAGESITFFPEGTSTNGKEVLKFNSSLFDLAAKRNFPVYAAAISYQVEQAGFKASTMVCWWDETAFITHLWRLFTLERVSASVHFCSSPLCNSNRKELARDLHELISTHFVPCD